jgi:hypothetical protein
MHAEEFKRAAAGRAAAKGGKEFEKRIGATFGPYAKTGYAYVAFMPIPMAPRGMMGKCMVYVPKGKAPFDVYGFAPRTAGSPPESSAVFVGAELKRTKDHQTRLPIVHPDAESGDGLKYHQLWALANVAKYGGVARVVWDNGGEVGYLDEQRIAVALAVYDQSLATERRGKGMGPQGSRSIPWENFQPVDDAAIGGVVGLHWLILPWREGAERRAA